jgi:IS5 family transposase
MLTPASANDLTVARPLLPYLRDCELYGDKIYRDAELVEALEQQQRVRLFTPVKRKKGQKRLHYDQKLHSMAVSRMRQPIESLAP